MENNLSLMAKDIFKRDYFESYSEFYLALAMGNVLNRRGYTLNMDYMRIDADAVPPDMIKYYKRLLADGIITMSMYEKSSTILEKAETDVDTSYFGNIELAKEIDGNLHWSIDIAKENYGDYKGKFLDLLTLGHTLVHLVAEHLVRHILNGENRKLIINLDSHKAKSTFLYVNIYSILYTMDWVRSLVELNVDFGDYKVDLDYSIFCNNGRVSGRYRRYSVSEKVELLKKYNMVEGSILVLWERQGMCENSEYGHVSGAKLFRLDEIGDNFIGVTFMSLNKTKEEVRQDYYDIDESIRYLFVDMLNKPPYLESCELDMFGVGINNHFFDESQFITVLDESEEVFKTVTIDGDVVTVKMSGINAIYWLLCQYNVEFDRELFKNMYFSNGETPMWDIYNE